MKTGYLNPGVQWAQDEEEAKKKISKKGDQSRAWAIFLDISIGRKGRGKAASYAGNNAYEQNLTEPVLEVEVPTKFLRIPHEHGSGRFLSATEGFLKNYSSTAQFNPGEVQYTNTHDTGGPALPLNYINGVWNLKSSKHPYFIPLEEYVDYLYKNIGERLPEGKKLDTGARDGKYKRRNSDDISNKKWHQFEEFINSELSSLDSMNRLLLKSAEKVRNLIKKK